MLEYLIIAFSFALSSLWFIHKKGLKAEGINKYPFGYNIAFIIMVTVGFPVILFGWIFNSKEFIKGYGKALAKIIKEDK